MVGLGSTILIGLIVTLVGIGSGGRDIEGITVFVKSEIQEKGLFYLPVKIILEVAEAIGDALFDIVLTIPEKSREIESGEDLLISLELINFGGPGETDVSIAYIITNSKGDIVLIEHEKRVVETQVSFLKTIDIPDLSYGKYKLFVEMLYSNTSAIATGEFRAI